MGVAHTGTRGQIHQIGLANLIGAVEVAAAYDTVAAVVAAAAGRLAVAAAAWVKAYIEAVAESKQKSCWAERPQAAWGYRADVVAELAAVGVAAGANEIPETSPTAAAIVGHTSSVVVVVVIAVVVVVVIAAAMDTVAES